PEDLPPAARYSFAAQQLTLPWRLQYAFDASESSDDIKLSSYTWDFLGDGNFTLPSSSPFVTHTYQNIGIFQTTLKVRDNTGQTSTTAHPVYVPSVWNSFGGQPGACTRQSAVNGPSNSHVAWTYQAAGNIATSPVVGPDGSIYFGDDNGQLY